MSRFPASINEYTVSSPPGSPIDVILANIPFHNRTLCNVIFCKCKFLLSYLLTANHCISKM